MKIIQTNFGKIVGLDHIQMIALRISGNTLIKYCVHFFFT